MAQLGEWVAGIAHQASGIEHSGLSQRIDEAVGVMERRAGRISYVGAMSALVAGVATLFLTAPIAAWILGDELTLLQRAGAVGAGAALTFLGLLVTNRFLDNMRLWLVGREFLLWLTLWAGLTFGPQRWDQSPEWLQSGWAHIGLLSLAFFLPAVAVAAGLIVLAFVIADVGERRRAIADPESALIYSLARSVKEAQAAAEGELPPPMGLGALWWILRGLEGSKRSESSADGKELEAELRTWVIRLDFIAGRFETEWPRKLRTRRYGVDRATRAAGRRISAEIRRVYGPLLLARLKNGKSTIDFAVLRDDIALALARIVSKPEDLPELDANETEIAREGRMRKIAQSAVFGLSLVIAALLTATVLLPEIAEAVITPVSPDLWDFLSGLENALLISAAGAIVAAASGWLWNTRLLIALQERRSKQ